MQFDFQSLEGFEWDRGNLTKSVQRHGITNDEAEEVFFRSPVVADASRPDEGEPRWFALGPSERGRILRIVFTMRARRIRVISARVASREERTQYEKTLRQK